jgi:hypothetical protein
VNGVIYVTGADYTLIGPWSAFAAYDISTDTWTAITVDVLNNEYEWETATPLANPANNTVLIVVHDPFDWGPERNIHTVTYDPVTGVWDTGPDFPVRMSLGQWFDYIREGWERRLTTVSRPVFDAGSDRFMNGEFGSNVDRLANATIGDKMVTTDGADLPRWLTVEGGDTEEYGWGTHLA